jgi:ATP-binding cassette subfamily B protein RaxB
MLFPPEALVLQSEAAECGLACLAMIARAHHRNESLSELRRRFPVSLSGSTLKSLMNIADAMGFSTRPIRCDLAELGKLALPAILHWDLDHYVVLKKVSRDQILILDPARGERSISLADASRSFTGVALELTPSPAFEPRSTRDRVRLGDLWGRITGLTPFLAQVIALSLLLNGLALLSPLASQIVVDDVLGSGDRQLLNAVLIGFGALAIIQVSVELLRSFIQLHASQRLSIQLSSNLLKHLFRLPIEFFERRHVGDIVTRFGSLGAVQAFITGGIVAVVLDGVMVIPVAIIMALYSPTLSLIVLCALVAMLVFQAAFFPIRRRLQDEQLSLSGVTQSIFLESVRGVRAVKLAGRETERHAHWQNATAEQLNNAYRLGSLGIWGVTGLTVVVALQGILLLFFGAQQVIEKEMSLGMFFAFQAYAAQFTARSASLVRQYFSFRMLGLHLERLADIVHTDPEPDGHRNSFLARDLQGVVEVRDLKFRYGEQDPWVLANVSLRIEAGQSVAIIGPSGGGKSTLLKLLTGLYSPSEGRVLFDGQPISAIGAQGLRERIGVVMQDDHLLSGTVAENVSFFDPHTDLARVEEACIAACVHDEIARTPMGYHSLIGDMGSILSGGQRQRILLARALYKQPAILLMDEGTANLDSELEGRVLANLEQLRITRIMVAHRQAAISVCQRAFVVEHGAVVELDEHRRRTSDQVVSA